VGCKAEEGSNSGVSMLLETDKRGKHFVKTLFATHIDIESILILKIEVLL
jgi:hypothetical protein